MYHNLGFLWKELLELGLKEDGRPWDWTALGIHRGRHQKLTARILAKSTGVWAAESLIEMIPSVTPHVHASNKIQDGTSFKNQDCLVEISGQADELLALERPLLNLAAYVSGIATATRQIVEKVHQVCPKKPPRICLTRKTLPGYRDVAIHGVRVGGGFPHRVSLSGGVLIKENHIAAAGHIARAIEEVRKTAPHGLKIEVEVRTEEELIQALDAKAEGVLLDNYSPEEVRSALELIKKTDPHVFIEVSGGIYEGNIQSYAIEGIDIISLGSLTHTVKSVDLSLLVYG